MQGIASVDSCQVCSDATAASCSSGTCAAGYHTYTPGGSPTCAGTCTTVVNAEPGATYTCTDASDSRVSGAHPNLPPLWLLRKVLSSWFRLRGRVLGRLRAGFLPDDRRRWRDGQLQCLRCGGERGGGDVHGGWEQQGDGVPGGVRARG